MMNALEETAEFEAFRKLRIDCLHHFDGRGVNALSNLYTDNAVCEFGPQYPLIRLLDDRT